MGVPLVTQVEMAGQGVSTTGGKPEGRLLLSRPPEAEGQLGRQGTGIGWEVYSNLLQNQANVQSATAPHSGWERHWVCTLSVEGRMSEAGGKCDRYP